jgi:beta-lactamase class A
MGKIWPRLIWGTAWALSLVIVWQGSRRLNPPNPLVQTRENTAEYQYINPLLFVDSPDPAPEFSNLRQKLAAYIDGATARGEAEAVSVYFRDANTGRWTGVNEDETYDPSSMLKVAMMMGYLREAAKNPALWNQQLDYTPRRDPGQNYPPAQTLAPGRHSVRQLVEAMIINSDNDALTALYNHDREIFVEVLKRLQIPPPPDIATADFMSPKTYSRLFRTLYSATYLSPDLSEAALNLLAHTNFTRGFVAGLPAGTVIAHKFGEHTLVSQKQPTIRQLHECGLIYYPGNPYLLCVMTRGRDFGALEKILADLARISYEGVRAFAPKALK